MCVRKCLKYVCIASGQDEQAILFTVVPGGLRCEFKSLNIQTYCTMQKKKNHLQHTAESEIDT